MGKTRRIILGTTLAGFVGLGSTLYYDFSPPLQPTQMTIERPVSSSDYFDTIQLRTRMKYGDDGRSCDHHVIVRSFTRKHGDGWDGVEGWLDIQPTPNCIRRPLWNYDGFPLGRFGNLEDQFHLTANVKLVLTWEGGGQHDLGIAFNDYSEKAINPEEENKLPASTAKFREHVPTVAKDINIRVEFETNTHGMYGDEYYTGFSRTSFFPPGSKKVENWNVAEAQLRSWLEDKSGIVVRGSVPLREVSQDTYEQWFRQKIENFMIDKLDRYTDPAITRLEMVPTKHGLEINLGFTNPTFAEDIGLFFGGFDVTDAIDSTGRIIRHYDKPLEFPLVSPRSSLPPQYSTEGKIIIYRHHTIPKEAKYLVGSLTFGGYESDSYANRRLHHNPVVVEISSIGEPEFRGRFGIRGWISDTFNSIRKNFANQ